MTPIRRIGLTLPASLVDAITYEKATDPNSAATASAILGPFFREDHPVRQKADTIHITKAPDAVDVYFYGRVIDGKTGRPLANAKIDVWQASTNGECPRVVHSADLIDGTAGYYEQQDDNQVEHNLRGQFITDARGEYAFYCIKPTPYPVPTDGPGGKLLHLMDRQIMRPAHIHLMVSISFSRCSIVIARMTQSVILPQIHLTAK